MMRPGEWRSLSEKLAWPVLALLGVYLLWVRLDESSHRRETRSARMEELAAERLHLEKSLEKAIEYRLSAEDAEKRLIEVENTFPGKRCTRLLLSSLEKLAKQEGLSINTLRLTGRNSGKSTGRFRTLEVMVNLSGSYGNLRNFIEQAEREFTINKLKLEQNKSDIDCTIDLALWHSNKGSR